MDYNFPSFKIYFIFVAFLLLIFLVCFIPSADIHLFLSPEPLIVGYDLNINTRVDKTFLHINTISGEIVSIVKARSNPEFQLVDDLVFDDGNKALVFYKKDMENFIKQKSENILSQSINEMEIKELHPETWDIRLTDKEDMPTSATLKVNISENTYPLFKKESLKRLIVFSKEDKAKEKIKSRIDVDNIAISKRFSLFGRLPFFKTRINFVIN